MKIAILSSLLPPYGGGAEQAAYAQALELQKKGNEVFFISLVFGKKLSIKIYRIRPKNLFHYKNIGDKPVWLRFLWHIIDTFNFLLVRDILKILKREKPDLVICHNLKGLSYFVPKVIKALDVRYWQVVHDVSLYTPSGLIEYGKERDWEHIGFLTRTYRFFTRRLFSYANKVFFPSQWLLNFYEKNGFFKNQEKIYKPNCYRHREERDALVPFGAGAIISFKPKQVILLYVGQLEKHKGILLLLDAFDEIYKDNPRVVIILKIVGDGSLMPEIKLRAQKNPQIKIYGKLPQNQLNDFYKTASALIVPSICYENAPNVILEALAHNTPIIASRIGGIPEMLENRSNCRLFEPKNIRELKESMIQYIEDN